MAGRKGHFHLAEDNGRVVKMCVTRWLFAIARDEMSFSRNVPASLRCLIDIAGLISLVAGVRGYCLPFSPLAKCCSGDELS